MKNKVVYFLERGGAKVLVNPSPIEAYEMMENVLINPDLGRVRGVSPEHWKRDGDTVVPMDLEEKIELDTTQEVDTSVAAHIEALNNVIKDIQDKQTLLVSKVTVLSAEKQSLYNQLISFQDIARGERLYNEAVSKEFKEKLYQQKKQVKKWAIVLHVVYAIILVGGYYALHH